MSKNNMESYGAVPSRRRRQRGAYSVEVGLLLPALLLGMMGMFDFARGYYKNHVVLEAARIGARSGAMVGKSRTEVVGEVRAFLEDVGMDDATIETTNVGDDGSFGDITEVEVSVGYEPILGGLLPDAAWANDMTLTQSVRVRHE